MTVQLTVFEYRSQELRWCWGEYLVFKSNFCISRDNYVVNLMLPLFESCRVPGDIHYIHDVTQPGGNHTLCNHRRQHVVVNIIKSWIGIVPLFFQYIAWMKCSAGREFHGQCDLKDNRSQQSSLWRRIDWVSLVGADYSSSSSFSNSTPLLFRRLYTVFFCDFLQCYYLLLFFFKRKAFYQFSPFNTNFERHRRFLVIHYLSDQNVLVLSGKVDTVHLFPFLMIFHEHIVSV